MANNEEIENLIVPTKASVTYSNYLKVDELLSLQSPLTSPEQHDETLFIIIHQVYELWFKQILHEMDEATAALEANNALRFLRALRRVHVIQDILIHQVDVIETMTPSDFNQFRERLNPASGFQSHQFRIAEFRLGLKDPGYLKFFNTQPEVQAQLQKVLSQATLYDGFLSYLKRQGYPIPSDLLNRDVSQPHQTSADLTQIFVDIYKNTNDHYSVYSMLEHLIDLDEKLEIWRYRHVAMVKRMIGVRTGTGGSTGAKYLQATLSKRCFPEIWEVRNHLS